MDYEFKYYKHWNYETKNAKTKITYCVRDAWLDGLEDDAIHTIEIFKTPFNWSCYDKPYWWGKQEEGEQMSKKFEEIIQQGESNTVEFKSTLVYNLETKVADYIIKEMIDKTICAFLNSKGGFLFIGINDNGSVGGLDFDFSLANGKNPTDYFQLTFDEILEHSLGFSKTSLINWQFCELEEKQIFAVEVFPIKTRPFFLKKKKKRNFMFVVQHLQDKLKILKI